MMSEDIVIQAEGLGKKYLIGHQAEGRQNTLRDAISHGLVNFARTARDMARGKPIITGDEIEEFWALKDASFKIRRGETVGIIGRNGAGKSTLLKVLSRITEPSDGRVEMRGRVASLLEVGTGFHPELSGRENIYLNGAIMGMTRTEIRSKFEEIVDFAGVEKFLDTPVKRYSSGMYVRLAFAVAAHLEPEILIVDEVLAVGDAEFQKKCLGKMQDVAGEGRTVLFVSHNMGAISSLCSRSILFEGGVLSIDGSSNEVISQYSNRRRLGPEGGTRGGSSGDYGISIVSTSLEVDSADRASLSIEATIISPVLFSGVINIFLKDEARGGVGACSLGGMGSANPIVIKKGENKLHFMLELPRLAEGLYIFDFEIVDRNKNRLAVFEDIIDITMNPRPDSDCSETLRQSWGFGTLWIKASIL